MIESLLFTILGGSLIGIAIGAGISALIRLHHRRTDRGQRR